MKHPRDGPVTEHTFRPAALDQFAEFVERAIWASQGKQSTFAVL
jgi:hypothetical protein